MSPLSNVRSITLLSETGLYSHSVNMPSNNEVFVMVLFATCLFKSAVRDAVHDSCERKLAALKREAQARLMSPGDVNGGSVDEFSTRLI